MYSAKEAILNRLPLALICVVSCMIVFCIGILILAELFTYRQPCCVKYLFLVLAYGLSLMHQRLLSKIKLEL